MINVYIDVDGVINSFNRTYMAGWKEQWQLAEILGYQIHWYPDLIEELNKLSLASVLIVVEAQDEKLELAARNLPHVDVRDVQGSDPVSLIAYEKVLVTVSAVKKFEELLG